MTEDKGFERIRDGIYQELLKANIHFKISWGIRLANEKINKAREVYLTFFFYTMWANNDRFCIGIYNVLKPDSKTANFEKLFNYVRSNKFLSTIYSQKEIDEMKEVIQSHKDLINRIIVVRDQYIAHNQLRNSHFMGKIKYEYEEGRTLLRDLNNVLNRLSCKYNKVTYSFDVSPHLNIEDMLRHLTEYRTCQIKQRVEDINKASISQN